MSLRLTGRGRGRYRTVDRVERKARRSWSARAILRTNWGMSRKVFTGHGVDVPSGGQEVAKPRAISMELTGVRVPMAVVLHREPVRRPREIHASHEEALVERDELWDRHRKPGPEQSK